MTTSAKAIGEKLAKIAVNLEQSNGQAFDRYFGAFVATAPYIEQMRANGTEYSTRMAFEAEVRRLLAEPQSHPPDS